mmetsp:Transcript_77090/g.223030  ORF Transcript_77090/g.223030 Transcript_77090/m.223030 type:complete len:325 (-) Transcript_77090:1227-2201(-)
MSRQGVSSANHGASEKVVRDDTPNAEAAAVRPADRHRPIAALAARAEDMVGELLSHLVALLFVQLARVRCVAPEGLPETGNEQRRDWHEDGTLVGGEAEHGRDTVSRLVLQRLKRVLQLAGCGQLSPQSPTFPSVVLFVSDSDQGLPRQFDRQACQRQAKPPVQPAELFLGLRKHFLDAEFVPPHPRHAQQPGTFEQSAMAFVVCVVASQLLGVSVVDVLEQVRTRLAHFLDGDRRIQLDLDAPGTLQGPRHYPRQPSQETLVFHAFGNGRAFRHVVVGSTSPAAVPNVPCSPGVAGLLWDCRRMVKHALHVRLSHRLALRERL